MPTTSIAQETGALVEAPVFPASQESDIASRNALLIALIFCALGIVGTQQWLNDRILMLEKENAVLVRNIRAFGCESPDQPQQGDVK